MNKTFCSHCGHKMLYEIAKPKYCSDCTRPLGGAPVIARERPAYVAPQEEEEYYDDIDEPLVDLSTIRLNVQIDPPTGTQIGSIAGTTKGVNIDREFKRRKNTASALRKRVKSDAPIDL